MKKVAIIGAGPAGLSAAYELLSKSDEYQVTIYEKDFIVGGLSKTYEFEGGRVDVGGHRFFTKNEYVWKLWNEILPKGKNGMLVRERKSHILWNSKLITYPIELSVETIKTLGFVTGMNTILSYLFTKFQSRTTDNLEDFYIKHFGNELYKDFFKDYTYKLWGLPASSISSDWGRQRIRKVSLGQLVHSIFKIRKGENEEERSLIKKFYYPAYGSGQLWEMLEKNIIELGGNVEKNCYVDRLVLNNLKITEVEYIKDGERYKKKYDFVFSSMPLNELVESIDNVPLNVQDISNRLRYRDMIIVAMALHVDYMSSMYKKVQKDSWIYIQDTRFKCGRIQILNNWSPYAARVEDQVLLELELFCDKNEYLWNLSNSELLELSINELIKCDICSSAARISSYIVKRIEKAYPIYIDGYYQLDDVKNWINRIDNLFCIGRNGQHRYNNMDHSVETGIEAARSIMRGSIDRKRVWTVNTKEEYLEK